MELMTTMPKDGKSGAVNTNPVTTEYTTENSLARCLPLLQRLQARPSRRREPSSEVHLHESARRAA